MVEGLEFQALCSSSICGSGFRAWGLGFGVWDSGFRVWVLGFRVEG